MRHILSGFVFCLIVNSGTLMAHKEPVHQHITREAFKLLLKSYPQLACSQMAAYVGNNETNTNSLYQSWGDGKLVSGAWLEDWWDIAYHYGLGRRPNFNQWSADEFARLFTNEQEAFSSITHFWNADGGLNAPSDLSDIAYIPFGTYWSFSCENAMQKMYKYLNGDFDNRWIYKSTRYWECAPFCYLGSDQRMGNLFQLYNQTLQIYAVGYLDCFSGYWTDPYNECPTIYYNIKYVYEQLGRMCHLLEDQCVPAHVHCNSHANKAGMYADYYEEEVPNWHLWTANEVYNAGGTFINPYNSWSDPLYYLMYLMNQATDHYASGRSDGDNNYDQNCPALSQIYSTLGAVPVTQSQINQQNCQAMHDKLFPLAIRVTAGLLYWFAMETGMISGPPSPLSVSILGPEILPSKANGSWSADVSPTCGVSYQWYEQDEGSQNWTMLGTSQQQTYRMPIEVSITMRCDVRDNITSEYASASLYVYNDGLLAPFGSWNLQGEQHMPTDFTVTQNYPNPFNPETQISFALPEPADVTITVSDLLGREITRIASARYAPGYHTARWGGMDATDNKVGSGIYFYRINAVGETGKSFTKVMKMLLAK